MLGRRWTVLELVLSAEGLWTNHLPRHRRRTPPPAMMPQAAHIHRVKSVPEPRPTPEQHRPAFQFLTPPQGKSDAVLPSYPALAKLTKARPENAGPGFVINGLLWDIAQEIVSGGGKSPLSVFFRRYGLVNINHLSTCGIYPFCHGHKSHPSYGFRTLRSLGNTPCRPSRSVRAGEQWQFCSNFAPGMDA